MRRCRTDIEALEPMLEGRQISSGHDARLCPAYVRLRTDGCSSGGRARMSSRPASIARRPSFTTREWTMQPGSAPRARRPAAYRRTRSRSLPASIRRRNRSGNSMRRALEIRRIMDARFCVSGLEEYPTQAGWEAGTQIRAVRGCAKARRIVKKILSKTNV